MSAATEAADAAPTEDEEKRQPQPANGSGGKTDGNEAATDGGSSATDADGGGGGVNANGSDGGGGGVNANGGDGGGGRVNANGGDGGGGGVNANGGDSADGCRIGGVLKGDDDVISLRGRKALVPFSAYIAAVNEAKAKPWSEDKPDGFFLMAMAESILTFDLIHEKIKSCRAIPPTIGLYSNFRGGPRIRSALAKMMQRTFMHGVEVNPEHICVSSGVTAVLDLFFFATCNPGDGCFIPAPYFPAFDNDMGIRNSVIPIPIQPLNTRTYIPTVQELECALSDCKRRGIRPRVLLLTNPGNPLGTLYPEATLREMLVWAVKHRLHVLTDEIYANSKFGASDDEFVSMECVAGHAVAAGLLDEADVAARVHTAYGMSKDFGMNGFRVGCLHTKNTDLLKLWQNMGMFAAVSNDTQHALSLMLEDDDFVDTYVSENKRRLKHSYELLTSAFEEAGMPYMPACAAMFCWLDFRSILPHPTFEGERRLWREILDECRIVVTPGEACHYGEPGFFRVCYAGMPPDHLRMACSRLKQFWRSKLDTRVQGSQTTEKAEQDEGEIEDKAKEEEPRKRRRDEASQVEEGAKKEKQDPM